MNESFEETIEKLLRLPKFGNGPGLCRTANLCQEALNSSWAAEIDPINVVGSNGKGSTTAIISAILSELGFKVGQYTSPHLFEFSERIKINAGKIPPEDLMKLTRRTFEKQAAYLKQFPGDRFGAFEVFTALAIAHFFQRKAEAVVLEAGIGGRYDPTRLMTGRFIAFTSLDREHAKILGETEELIAYDKLDIAPEGSNVILGKIDEEVQRKLAAYAQIKKVNLLPIEDFTRLNSISFEADKMRLNFEVEGWTFPDVSSSLMGYHQVNNIRVAVLLTKKWLAYHFPQFTQQQFTAAVRQALAKVQWPGRLEKIHAYPEVYIDAAHTPDAVRQLVKSFREINQKDCLIVVGASYDKDAAAIVSELLPLAQGVICTRAYHKGAPPGEIFKLVEKKLSLGFLIDQSISPASVGERAGQSKIAMPIYQYDTIEKALDFALTYARENNMVILIAGGLFLSIEAYAYLKGKNPAQLRFF